jgi:hypothetical protein
MASIATIRVVWRCAGCGDVVSEWAACCGGCGWSVEDAYRVEDPTPELGAAADQTAAGLGRGARPMSRAEASLVWMSGRHHRAQPGRAGTTRWPVSSRPVRQVVAVIAAVGVAVAAAVVFAGRGAGPGLPGFVVSAEGDGTLVISPPDGAAPTPLQDHGLELDGLIPSAGGRYLLTGSGQLVTIRGATLKPTGRSVSIPADGSVVGLADRDRVAITVGPGPDGFSPVFATPFGQARVPLGAADNLTPDPGLSGVIAVVASPNLLNPQTVGYPPGNPAFPVDVRVELAVGRSCWPPRRS